MLNSFKNYTGNQLNGSYNLSYHRRLEKNLTSSYYSVKFVRRGNETYTKAGEEVALEANEMLLCRPHEHITASIDSKDTTEGVCLYLSEELLDDKKDILNSLGGGPGFKLSIIDTALYGFYAKMCEEEEADVVLTIFLDVFETFLSDKRRKLDCLKSKRTSTRLHLWENLEKSKRYILNNFRESLDLEDIADSACMSKYHFQRNFKDFYQTSPTQYLQKVRLRFATKLLDNDLVDINRAAYESGYNDVKYFKKCLAKYACDLNKNPILYGS